MKRIRPTTRPLAPLLAAALLVVAAAGCGGPSSAATASGARRAASRRAVPHLPSYPIVRPLRILGRAWRPVATVSGRVAAWVAEREGVTLLRIDQGVARLALHSGSVDPGGSGWTYGDRIEPAEIHRIVAAFNGGFRLSYGSVGFMSEGRVEVPLRAGLASIVTYREGTTQIGTWRADVPEAGRPVASVLQNLRLLVDRGTPAASTTSCVITCWGATLGGGDEVARSALGVTGEGQLVWGAGETLSPAVLAQAMASAGVQRAVELDINPEWVAGYLYVHRRGGPAGVPLVAGQPGIPGRFLTPYERDFFTILAS